MKGYFVKSRINFKTDRSVENAHLFKDGLRRRSKTTYPYGVDPPYIQYRGSFRRARNSGVVTSVSGLSPAISPLNDWL